MIFLCDNRDYVYGSSLEVVKAWYEENAGLNEVECTPVKEDFVIYDWKSGQNVWASDYCSQAVSAGPVLLAHVYGQDCTADVA